MSISLSVSNKVKFKVSGVTKDASGVDQAFSFHLICKRMDKEKTSELIQEHKNDAEFMAAVIEDWDDVRDASGAPLPYSADNWRELDRLYGLAGLAAQTYIVEKQAKAKN